MNVTALVQIIFPTGEGMQQINGVNWDCTKNMLSVCVQTFSKLSDITKPL